MGSWDWDWDDQPGDWWDWRPGQALVWESFTKYLRYPVLPSMYSIYVLKVPTLRIHGYEVYYEVHTELIGSQCAELR